MLRLRTDNERINFQKSYTESLILDVDSELPIATRQKICAAVCNIRDDGMTQVACRRLRTLLEEMTQCRPWNVVLMQGEYWRQCPYRRPYYIVVIVDGIVSMCWLSIKCNIDYSPANHWDRINATAQKPYHKIDGKVNLALNRPYSNSVTQYHLPPSPADGTPPGTGTSNVTQQIGSRSQFHPVFQYQYDHLKTSTQNVPTENLEQLMPVEKVPQDRHRPHVNLEYQYDHLVDITPNRNSSFRDELPVDINKGIGEVKKYKNQHFQKSYPSKEVLHEIQNIQSTDYKNDKRLKVTNKSEHEKMDSSPSTNNVRTARHIHKQRLKLLSDIFKMKNIQALEASMIDSDEWGIQTTKKERHSGSFESLTEQYESESDTEEVTSKQNKYTESDSDIGSGLHKKSSRTFIKLSKKRPKQKSKPKHLKPSISELDNLKKKFSTLATTTQSSDFGDNMIQYSVNDSEEDWGKRFVRSYRNYAKKNRHGDQKDKLVSDNDNRITSNKLIPKRLQTSEKQNDDVFDIGTINSSLKSDHKGNGLIKNIDKNFNISRETPIDIDAEAKQEHFTIPNRKLSNPLDVKSNKPVFRKKKKQRNENVEVIENNIPSLKNSKLSNFPCTPWFRRMSF